MSQVRLKLFLFSFGFTVVSNASAEMVSGILHGEQEITIKSKSQGEITKLHFDEGAPVKENEVIAVIDDRQEEIERKIASIEYETAEKDYEKTQGLHKYVSKDELIEKKNAALRKKSVYDLKEYSYIITRVMSPINGIITKKYFDKGETVSVGDKVFEVVQIDSLIIEINVPSVLSAKLSIGQELSFKTDLQKDQKFKAAITYISPVIDPASGTVKVRLSLKNTLLAEKTYLHKPGTLVSVEL